MASSVWAVVHIQASSKSSIKPIIDAVGNSAGPIKADEPEALKYVIARPDGDETNTSIYVVEEYASAAAAEAHRKSEPFTSLVEVLTQNHTWLAGPAIPHLCSPIASFTRPTFHLPRNPYVVLTQSKLRAGTIDPVRTEDMRALVAAVEREEKGTLSYAILQESLPEAESSVKEEILWFIEIFQDEGYYREVHRKSEALAEFTLKLQGEGIILSMEESDCCLAGGFWR